MNPIILAVETATSTCSAALLKGDTVLASKSLTTDRKHNEILPGIVDSIFSESGLSFPELNLLAVSNGPGSFTGLRVGLSYVKGIALGLEIPFVPVRTLDALAITLREHVLKSYDNIEKDTLLMPLVVARKGEVFAKLFQFAPDELFPTAAGDVFVESYPGILSRCNSSVIAGGEGAEHLFQGKSLEACDHFRYHSGIDASAVNVGKSGHKQWREKPEEISATWDLEPFYFKEFTVKTS